MFRAVIGRLASGPSKEVSNEAAELEPHERQRRVSRSDPDAVLAGSKQKKKTYIARTFLAFGTPDNMDPDMGEIEDPRIRGARNLREWG